MPLKIEYDRPMKHPRLDDELKPVRPDVGETGSGGQFFPITVLFVVYLEVSLLCSRLLSLSLTAALQREKRVLLVLTLFSLGSYSMFLMFPSSILAVWSNLDFQTRVPVAPAHMLCETNFHD